MTDSTTYSSSSSISAKRRAVNRICLFFKKDVKIFLQAAGYWHERLLLFCQYFGYLPVGKLYFLFQRPGGHAQGSVPQNDKLLGAVRSCHAHAVAACKLIGGLFDIHIGCFGLFGIHDADAAVLLHLAAPAAHFVSVEHQNDTALAEALIIAQDVRKGRAGGVDVFSGKLFQLVPCEDDIIAVYQQSCTGGSACAEASRGRRARALSTRSLRRMGPKVRTKIASSSLSSSSVPV